METTMMSPRPAYFRREPPSTLMHLTMRAPELSAISRFVVTWIMGLLLHRARDQPGHEPALVTRDRPVLLDLNAIADLVLVRLVVRLVAITHADVLLVDRIRCVPEDLDRDGLVHLVAGDPADELPAEAVLFPRRRRRRRGVRLADRDRRGGRGRSRDRRGLCGLGLRCLLLLRRGGG